MFFGNKLKRCREENGLTQEDVAAFFGEDFSRQSVSKWERDEAYPEVEKLLKLAIKFEISLDELFEEELKGYSGAANKESIMDNYPGMTTGLKTLANILHQSK